MNGISRHTITVELAGRDEPLTVVTANPDLVQWDETRARKGWPTMTDAPMLWMTFLAWHAARRLGHFTDGWDAFRDACLDIDMEGEPKPVDPTQQAAVSG